VLTIIALLTLLITGYLSLAQWIKARPTQTRSAKKALELASQELVLKKFEEAKSIVLPYLHHPAVGHLAHLRYAEALRGLRRYDESLNCIRYAMRKYPEELQLRLEEGKVLLELQLPQEALSAFQICSPILRQESDVLSLCDALFKAGHMDTAWDLIHKRLDNLSNPPLKVLAAHILSAMGKLIEAIDLYTQAIEAGLKNHDVVIGLASAYRRYGNLQAAENLFKSLLEKDPSDVEATLGLGLCMEERELPAKALHYYQSSHAFEKQDSRLIKQAAFCAVKSHKFAEAEYYFSLLKDSLHLTAHILSYYGYSLERQEKWQEAEQVYIETITRFPSDPNGYRALAWMFGVGLSLTLNKEQGVTYGYIALKLIPDRTSWEILSACEARVGNFEKASQILEHLLQDESVIEKRSRLQAAIRSLRKHHPLDNRHVARELVA
jgi:tetratricopeptide (TPR) repeat protein